MGDAMDPARSGPAAARHAHGRHVLAELRGIDAALLDDEHGLRAALTEALTAAGARVRRMITERFAPQGVTLLAVLAESHASVHTWPEHGLAHIDVFTCGPGADPVHAVERLAAALHAQDVQHELVQRGTPRTWVDEPLAPGLIRRWTVSTVHYAARTPHQRVLIADTAHGVTLFCDDERQSAEATQREYHEALFVPAALLAARVDHVLVIGSGEGVVPQLAVAAGARFVDHVDIDPDCVRACARHLPYGYTPVELDNAERHAGPIRLHYTDGAAFVATCRRRYDLVVVDLPDERLDRPEAALNRLYSPDFLKQCGDLLTDGGVVVSQAGSPAMWRDTTLRTAWARFNATFAQVVPYTSTEHEWTFLIGRHDNTTDPVIDMLTQLPQLLLHPSSIDARTITARTVPSRRLHLPVGARNSAPTG